MKKKVYHYKRTPLALAPDALVKAINKYSKNWEAKLISKQEELPKDGSLVHFHNQFLAYSGPKLIQYHSEPQNRGCMPPNEFAQHPDLPKYQLVISQYHATLDEYKDCKVVRNVIDFLDPLFAPIQPTSHLITYSPSTKLKINEWFDKGYEETERILKGLGCEFDIIHGVPYEECIRRKARGSIHIDECVTGSFHRSGLEGLALGKLTICNVSPKVQAVMTRAANTYFQPFHVCKMEDLRHELTRILDAPFEWTLSVGKENREWMEAFWHPETIVQEFEKHYEMVLGR